MKKLYTNLLYLLMVMFFLNVTTTYAQTLNKPIIQFPFACANEDFNSFNVNFSWQTPLVASDNVFILELSDAEGSFSAPTQLTTVSNSNTTTDFTINFQFPTDTAGENYRVRVRATNPARTSPLSDSFSAYYANVDQALVINNFNNIILCGGSPSIINIDNFADEHSYVWRRNNVVITGQTGPSLMVSQEGSYYVEVDYGLSCSSDTASNIVEVIDGESGTSENVAITSSGNIDCETGESVTITSDIDDVDYEYTWYRNGNPVNGETSPTIEVSQGGTYFLEIRVGDCPIFSNELVITGGASGDISLDPGADIALSGEPVTVTASGGDSYQWFSPSGESIGSSAMVTLDAAGVYTLRAQLEGCEITRTVTVTGPGGPSGPTDFIPNVLTPNGDGINDTWQIPDGYAFNNNIEVIIYGPTGEILHQATAYANDWPQQALTYIVNNPVFYYRILEGSNVLEQGSITLIK